MAVERRVSLELAERPEARSPRAAPRTPEADELPVLPWGRGQGQGLFQMPDQSGLKSELRALSEEIASLRAEIASLRAQLEALHGEVR